MSIKIWELLSILFILWIADFIIQKGWQANNKSRRNDALLYHTNMAARYLMMKRFLVYALLLTAISSVLLEYKYFT
jgi:hypothetical protein